MSGPLISAAELLELLDLPDRTTRRSSLSRPVSPVVLDVRYRTGGPPGRLEFEAGHVPGAAYVDVDADLAAPPGSGGRHPLPEPEVFVAAMRRAGVDRGRPVVVYDDWAGRAAGRCWWLLRHYGHPNVRLLDGGWSAWRAAGGEVEEGREVARDPGGFTGEPGTMPVVDETRAPGALLVDARAPERYRGETEPIDPVAGHIPGAVNVPTDANLTGDGRFRPVAELRELYAAVGASREATDVAAYCGSGVTACHDILAMEVAGIRAALYPGSWSGWTADRSRPVETG